LEFGDEREREKGRSKLAPRKDLKRMMSSALRHLHSAQRLGERGMKRVNGEREGRGAESGMKELIYMLSPALGLREHEG
jgi:hypothetical protein